MSTDQQPAPYDPRYDGIYQRGGPDSTQQSSAQPVRHIRPQPSDRNPILSAPPEHADPRHGPPSSESEPPPSYSLAQPRHGATSTDAADASRIRDIGAEPERPTAFGTSRNPFDVWVWVAAAVLTLLGVCLLTAPIVGAEAYAEQMMSQTGTAMYTGPWWQHTSLASLPLILLGVGTALAQLFVLSIRHTLRTR